MADTFTIPFKTTQQPAGVYDYGLNVCGYNVTGPTQLHVTYSGSNLGIVTGALWTASGTGLMCAISCDTAGTIKLNFAEASDANNPTMVYSQSVTLENQLNGYYWTSVVIKANATQSTNFTETSYTIFQNGTSARDAVTGAQSGDGVVVEVVGRKEDAPTQGVVVEVVGKLEDPNTTPGTSTPGGGDGTFDETSDPVPIPLDPDISASDCGMITLFRPTLAQVQNLGDYLWTNIADIPDNFKKWLSNPQDSIISFHMVPVVPEVNNARNVKLGLWETTIAMPPVKKQWVTFDCGIVSVAKFWGSALDFSPNTKITVMLPFIGNVPLNTDEVMGNTIGAVYKIDLLSGTCVCMLTVNGDVYYQYTGECSVPIPLTGSDWSRIYSATIGAVSAAVTGGISASAAGSAAGAALAYRNANAAAKATHEVGYAYRAMAQTREDMKGMRGVTQLRKDMQEAISASAQSAKQAATASGSVSKSVTAARVANVGDVTLNRVMGAKHVVSHSGTITGTAGLLGIRTPYILIEYPNQSLADDYKHFVGYPSNMTSTLGSLSGYTECEQVLATGIPGTDDELAELIDALKGGVYL